jgi:hypothetical protein
MSEEKKPHMGTKFLGLFIGIVLSIIYAIMQFLSHQTLDMTILWNIALVEAFFVIVWTLIIILAELIWRYAHKYSEKLWE